MTIKKQREIINMALGETSALFMSQEIKGTQIIMPTEELNRISDEVIEKLNENPPNNNK